MQYIPKAKLWLVGKGDIEDKLKNLVRRLKLNDRVTFLGRISMEKLWDFTTQADVGVSLEENLGLNYEYALPNKLFDYLQARIPVVISDLAEMKGVVDNFEIGKVLYDRKPEKLAELFNGLFKNEIKSGYYKPKLELAARELCWEREEDKLLKLFRNERNSE
jgi:glycosyltransferase involved in cell wall biosynthesis